MRLRHNEGGEIPSLLFPTRDSSSTKKEAVFTTQRARQKKKVLTVQLASAGTFIWHMGSPRPSAPVMKESVSHNGAMTRAESPLRWGADACGDEDCNSRPDPPLANDSPSHAKGPNQGR